MNLNQITIHTDKTHETAAFYERIGLTMIVDSLPRYARLACPDGGATFSVHAAQNVENSPNIVLYFECANLDEKVSELKNLGLIFDQEPRDETWLWRESYLRDPNGNRICLYYAGENRQNPPWRVN